MSNYANCIVLYNIMKESVTVGDGEDKSKSFKILPRPHSGVMHMSFTRLDSWKSVCLIVKRIWICYKYGSRISKWLISFEGVKALGCTRKRRSVHLELFQLHSGWRYEVR